MPLGLVKKKNWKKGGAGGDEKLTVKFVALHLVYCHYPTFTMYFRDKLQVLRSSHDHSILPSSLSDNDLIIDDIIPAVMKVCALVMYSARQNYSFFPLDYNIVQNSDIS